MNSQSFRWRDLAGFVGSLVLGAGGLLPLIVGKGEPNFLGAAFAGFAALYFGHLLLSTRKGTGKPISSQAPAHGSGVTLAFDDVSITATFNNGQGRSIDWAALTQVVIRTSDEGPFVNDVFWGLYSGDEIKVAYPQDAVGGAALLTAMQERLHGFDNEAVIKAMGSTENARFTVWQCAGGRAR